MTDRKQHGGRRPNAGGLPTTIQLPADLARQVLDIAIRRNGGQRDREVFNAVGVEMVAAGIAATSNDGIVAAFEAFMRDGFVDAVRASTRAHRNGGGDYAVELLPNGSWRTTYRRAAEQTTPYVSPGIVIGVPALDEEQHEDEFYDDAEEEMRERFAKLGA